MIRSSAIVRLLDHRAQQPFTRRLVNAARQAAEELSQRLLGPDFAGRLRLLEERYQSQGGDPFGLDMDTVRQAAAICAFFHRLYFRTEVFGLHNIPTGRALLVANHSGQIPIDAAIIGSAAFFDAQPARVVRAMVDKWTATLPFVSAYFSKVGQVVGLPENARLLLERGELILVFPEGIRGVSKPFARRYQLESFGQGFMRLALETNTPIIPVAVVGAEEQYLNLGNLKWAARILNIPVFPVVPQVVVPGGQFPLPTRYRIYFGEPMRFQGSPDDSDATVADKVWLVQQVISDMLQRGLQTRKGVFF